MELLAILRGLIDGTNDLYKAERLDELRKEIIDGKITDAEELGKRIAWILE